MTTHITQTTHCFTLQQLRAATQAGGVAGVSLKGHGNGFFIQIQLRTGQQAVLITARSRSPRMFKNPAQAFGVLRRVGIVTGSFDVTHYVPEQQQTENTQSIKKENKKSAAKTKANKTTQTNKTATVENTVNSSKTAITEKSTPANKQTPMTVTKLKTEDKKEKEPESEQKAVQNLGVQQSLI